MKKFTILVALILCVTIGGVYAAWIYPNMDTNISMDRNVTVQLSDVDTTNKKGELTGLTGESGMSFFLDDANGDYLAEVKLSGYFEFLFTPNEKLPADSRLPIDLKYSLTFNKAPTYDGKTIVAIKSGKDVGVIRAQLITTENCDDLSVHGTDLSGFVGKYYYCIDANVLSDAFEALDVKLDTLDKYKDVDALIDDLNLKITLSDNDYVAP